MPLMSIEFFLNFCYTAQEVIWTRGRIDKTWQWWCVGKFMAVEKLRLTGADR